MISRVYRVNPIYRLHDLKSTRAYIEPKEHQDLTTNERGLWTMFGVMKNNVCLNEAREVENVISTESRILIVFYQQQIHFN